MAKPEYGTPEWWIEQLGKRLDRQAVTALFYETYYDGTQPLPLSLATQQYREQFRQFISAANDNWMPMVVGAKAERLTPTGFRFGAEPAADDVANRIWQENHLDGDIKLAIETALTTGSCPLLVWNGADDRPEITVEHPAQMVIAYESGSRRRRIAALKRWTDEWTGGECVNLYLPGLILKFVRQPRRKQYEQREAPLPNPLGEVPVVELRHRLRLRDSVCRSELMEVTSTQDILRITLVNALVAAEFQSFRQRWATGIDIPKDPETGQPVMPFKSAINRVWATPNKDAKFGDFDEVDLAGYVKLREQLLQSLVSRTATPPHYLVNGQVLPNAESVKAAETGLIARTKHIQVEFDEPIEEAMRLAFGCLDPTDPRRNDPTCELMWADCETRSEAEHVDAVLKKKSLDVPAFQLWADIGYTPAQIDRFRQMLVDEALARDAGALPNLEQQWAVTMKAKADALGVFAGVAGVDLAAAVEALQLPTGLTAPSVA